MVSPFMVHGNSSAYLAANPEAGALGLLVGAAYGLEYLHTRQPPITHGDLRGANILVSPSGEACLADFGLSKIMEVADISVGMTTANAGATRWMAPELFHAEGSEYPPSCPSPNLSPHAVPNEDNASINLRVSFDRRSEDFQGVTPRSDVWAYGMTVYELMTGKVPYWRIKNSPTVMLTILRGELPSRPRSHDVRHDWQPSLWELMQDCWTAKPSSRPTMSIVSARIRSIREAAQMKSPVPQSLLSALDTPLPPLSPRAQNDEFDLPILIESPTTEGTQLSHVLVISPEAEPIKLSDPPKKKRQSTTDSTLAKAEANDDVPELPELPSKRVQGPVSRADLMRPRSWSAPMAISIDFGAKEASPSPKQTMFQSLNSSLVSLGSDTNQSRVIKSSRPITPATPIASPTPDEPQPSTPTSPLSKTKHRISSFFKRTSAEKAPVEAVLSSEGGTDFSKTVLPILRSLIEEEETMLANNYDAVFSTRLRTKYPPLIPLDRIDPFLTRLLGGYVKLRRQRSLFLKALITAEPTIVSDLVPSLCKLLGETLDHLSFYPTYAYGIYGVEDKLSEEMESNFPFRAWMQSTEEDKSLKQFLKKPMASIETSFVRLSQLVAFAKLHCPKETKIELKLLEGDLVKLLMQTRLRKHQGALGRDEVIYRWRQLVARAESHAYVDEERQSIIFQVIETQMTFVRTMRDFHTGVLRRIVQAPGLSLPNLRRTFDEMTGIITMQTHVLSLMHKHQIQNHPLLTDIPDIIFESSRLWAGLYGPYCSLLKDAFGELERHNAEIFPLVHALSNPTIADHDLVSLLWTPVIHLRRLCKTLRSLLEVMDDGYPSLKVTVELISTISKLVELCDTLTISIGSSPEIRQLSIQLQWQAEEDLSLCLEDPLRQVLHSGNLLIPDSDSGGFTEVFTVVLDNNLLITIPRMHWGLSSLHVLHSVSLENLEIVDLDALDDIHDLYLLEAPQGETIAAPLPLRFEYSNAQKTVVLLCFTTLEAIEWRRHITTAKLARENSISAFSRMALSRGPLVMETPFVPSCSASFHLNGTTYYLVGGLKAAGLWIRKDRERIKRPLLSGVSVQQCTVFHSLKLLLVLSGRSLIFFKLEDIATLKISSRQVDTKGPVQFFHCGMHRKKPILVVAVGHGQMSSTTIRIYSAADTSASKGRRSSLFGGKDGFGSTFKILWETVVPQQLHCCTMLDDCIVLMGSDGFLSLNTDNIIDIKASPLPIFRGLIPTQTYQRCKASKALNVVRHNGHTLLCYQDFGVYIKEGVVQGHPIEWSTLNKTQALCVAPYVLLVSEDAIETRVIASGRLMDCLNGENLQVTQGADTSDVSQTSVFHLASVDRESARQFDIGVKDDSYSVYEWIAQPTK